MPKDSLRVVCKIFDHLKENGVEQEVIEKDIRKLIKLYGGISPATVAAYFSFMKDWKLIKNKGVGIYKVNWDNVEKIRNVRR